MAVYAGDERDPMDSQGDQAPPGAMADRDGPLGAWYLNGPRSPSGGGGGGGVASGPTAPNVVNPNTSATVGGASALEKWLEANGIGTAGGGIPDWLRKLVTNPGVIGGGIAGLAELFAGRGDKKSDMDVPEMRALLDLQKQRMLRVDPVRQSIELLASRMLPTYAREGITPYRPTPLTNPADVAGSGTV